MLKIGELVIYSSHGICRIDDITNKTFNGIEKSYYVLHPIENDHNLTFNVPIEHNKQVMIFKLMNKEEALKIIALFKDAGVEWIEKSQDRARAYTQAINSGKREEIAMILNTLIRKKSEIEKQEKKFYEYDSKLLSTIKNILFKEIAIALDISFNEVEEKVNKLIA